MQYTYNFSLSASKGSRLVEAERETADDLQVHLEAAVKDSVETKGISRSATMSGNTHTVCKCLCVCIERMSMYGEVCSNLYALCRSSYEAGQEWALPVQFCQLHALPLSSVYPQVCAADGQWLHFLLFVQLHSYPPQQVHHQHK